MEDDVSGASPGRRLRRTLLPLLAFSMVVGLLSGGPAVAHTFTKFDGNDSKGRLDIRSLTVSHTVTGAVVYKFRTYDSWRARDLGRNSFLLVQISKDEPEDTHYDLCAFIFFAAGKLRGSLTNCGRTGLRGLNVAKISGTTAKLTIPKPELPLVYWWDGASVWDGPAPCANPCVDFAPNRYPDIMHDIHPPTISNIVIPDNSATAPLTADSEVSFKVTDDSPGAGLQTWFVDRRLEGVTTWTNVDSGTTRGTKTLSFPATEGERYQFRVRAVDRQGNRRTSGTFNSFIPFDDDNGVTYGGPGGATDWTLTGDALHFQGGYHQTSTPLATMSITFTGDEICLYGGPMTGTTVTTTIDGIPISQTSWDTAAAREKILCSGTLAGPGPHTLLATVGTGPVVFDAYLVLT